MPYEGEAIHPEVWFIGSRDRCRLLEHTPITRFGQPYVLLSMIPEEVVRYRYGLKDIDEGGDISYEDSEFGSIFREYPRAVFDMSVYNPAAPVALADINFDGSESFDMERQVLKNQISRLEALVATKNMTIKQLQIDLKKAYQERASVGGAASES